MDEAAGLGGHHVAALFAFARPAHHERALRPGDAHVHQAALFLNAQGQAFGVSLGVFHPERQQPLDHAHQQHVRPFQPLGGVQGGKGDHVLVCAAFGNGGKQRHVLRHFQHAFGVALNGDAGGVVDGAAAAVAHPVAKFQHVVPAAGGDFFAVFAVVQVFFKLDVAQPFLQKRLGGLGAGGGAGAKFQFVQVAAKGVQAIHCALGQRGGQQGRKQRLEQADFVLVGKCAQLRECGVADAALGAGDGAQEGRVVVLVGQQAKPGAQILDFGAVEKALSARNLVRDLGLAQRGFQQAALVVGAVEYGKVLELLVRAVGAQALDAGHHALGLVFLVVGIGHAHRLAVAQRAPQFFGKQLGIGADHVVGGLQNCGSGSVVLLQLHHLELRKIHRQLPQVIERGAAPAVDALVVVAHSGEAGVGLAGVAHQQLEQVVLRGVGVLVFVHQHIGQCLLPFGAHVGVVLQKFQRQADQVVKVHALVGQQPLFVALHHHGGAAVALVARRLRQRGGGVQALVLPQADLPLPLPRYGRVGGAAAIFEQAQHVVAIQNAEVGLEIERRAVFAQHAHAQRVKGADDDFFGGLADQPLGAFAHFGGGLVGEGDGGNALRRAARLDQPCDLVRDDPRFARPRPGQHQTRPVQVVDCFLLRDVEAIGHGCCGMNRFRKRGG